MSKKSNTIITIGWGASFVVEPKHVSTLLEIFSNAQRVESRWTGEKSAWVEKEERSDRLTITQDASPVLTVAEFEAVKAAEEAKKAEEEAARAE